VARWPVSRAGRRAQSSSDRLCIVLPQYTPMAPTQVREPFHSDGWIYEEKVDGWRMLAYKHGERVRLMSRNGRDHTRRFAGIAAAIAKLSAHSWCSMARLRSTTRNSAPDSIGCASLTPTPSRRRPC
jgi:ATP-dependent DNA ligase